MAQMLIAGVLIIGPLIYTQTLPFMPIKLPEIYVLRTPPPPPPVVQTTEPISSTVARTTPRVFVPTRVPTGPIRQITDIVSDALPALDFGPAAVNVGDTLTGIPTIGIPTFGPAPINEVRAAVVSQPTTPAVTKPIAISGGVLAAKLISQLVPKYPPLARATRVSGTVRLLGIIDREGRVRNLKVLDGPPLLRQSALDAVSQWVYAPTLLNGQPVEVEAPIEVHFQLN